ncbi:hypothetical protein [Arcobacter sp. FWKO B]|uniref:hypothetical protein n=1 Tax=Arcobacter sp. FWKO B TaxID=2593672 RepID=UPI0018A555F0|nr:hypothetical protein [Arcobacter sp. FWKO B]QOG12446.1 hypothetical protein FWKOB_06910 [Arcobacter sp. FWKO B]
MNYLDIFGLLCFILMLYYFGLKKGIIFSILLVSIGVIIGLVQSGYFFGEIGEYIFLCLIILYGVFLYFRCPKELSKSLEGQGVCIKDAFQKFIAKL